MPGHRVGPRRVNAVHTARRLFLTVFLLFFASCTFPGAVRPTVKIGLVAPFEGRYRYVGYDVVYAVRLALREANAEGGIAGHGVELVAYDDRADPDMAPTQARKLDVDPDVVGAIGHFREETTTEALPAYAEAGLPLVASTGIGTPRWDGAAVHVLGPSADRVAAAVILQAEALTGDGAVLLVGAGGPMTEALQREAREKGLPVRAETVDAVDPASSLEEGVAQEAHVVVVCDLDPVEAGEVVAALRGRGWEGDILGGSALAMSDFAAVAGDSAVGATFVTPWPLPEDVPGGGAFSASYSTVSGGTKPGPLALPAYEAAWMLLEALQQAGSQGDLTRQGVASALPEVERDGLLGHLTFGAQGVASDLELFWYRFDRDGVPVLIEPVLTESETSAAASMARERNQAQSD